MSAPSTAAMAARLVEEGARPDSAELLASMMLDKLAYPAHGGVPVVVDANGKPSVTLTGAPVSVADLLQGFRAALPELWADRTTTSAPAPQTVTARVVAEDRENRMRQASPQPSNPWAKGSLNLTQQVLISSRDPERAARLKSEAGL